MKQENTTPTKDTKRYVPYGINGMYYIYDNQEHYCLPGQSGSSSRRMIKRKCEQLNQEENRPPTPTKEGLHTQGELWRDDDGFIAIGMGDNYHTFADLDCSDLDIAEREANKDRLIECWNNYDALVNERKALLDALKACYNCLTIDSDMEEDFAPEIKQVKKLLDKAGW